VRVKLGASGLCYSDEHLRKGDYAFDWSPCLGGHEGAGVVTDVGELVTTVGPGDHVVLSFMPSCGDCPDCVDGRQNLCERGALLFSGVSVYDGTQRFSWRGRGVGQFCLLGTFAEYTVVHEKACIPIDRTIPLDKAALVGCGVTTGFGTGAVSAGTQVGDVCVVVGVGGVGMNAVQGFRAAGASAVVAIDIVRWKAQAAVETFGATHAATSIEEAHEIVGEVTRGRMAQRLAYTVNEADGRDIAPVMRLLGKRGGHGPDSRRTAGCARRAGRLLRHHALRAADPRHGLRLHQPPHAGAGTAAQVQAGTLKLDELITTTYSLDQINDCYADLNAGKNIRGVLRYE
jgi:Zn-dependent alcohol dehydrogenase